MSDRGISEAITKITGLHKVDQVTYVSATVLSVDLNTNTCSCSCIEGHTEYQLPNVKLMSQVDDGLLIEPEIGSTVMVIFSQNVLPCVVQYSEIKNITIFANTKITLQDGSFGGLVKVNDLVSKINALENDLNMLKTIFQAWTPVPSDGGAVLKALSTMWAGQTITNTVNDDLENKTILHGTN